MVYNDKAYIVTSWQLPRKEQPQQTIASNDIKKAS